MWDTHWCETLAKGTAALASRVDGFLHEVRTVGGVVLHAPAQTEPFYEQWPQYAAAQRLRQTRPAARSAPVALDFGTSEGCGCDDAKCVEPDAGATEWPWPWRRQHESIRVEDGDFIVCEDGDAAYGVLAAVNPARVLICGVHTDKCVLDRPFGMIAMWIAGVDMTLVGDLTEASQPRRTREVVDTIARVLPVMSSLESLVAGIDMTIRRCGAGMPSGMVVLEQ